MTRPKLPEGQARDKVVAVRLNQRSYEKLQNLAKAKGMTVSAYVHKALLMITGGDILIR